MTRHSYALPENFDRWSVIEHTHVDGAAILPDEFVCDNCHLVAYRPRGHIHYIAGKLTRYCHDCDQDWRAKVRDAFKPPVQTIRMAALAGEQVKVVVSDPDWVPGAQSGEPLTGSERRADDQRLQFPFWHLP